MTTGFDSEGCYHDPELRYERMTPVEHILQGLGDIEPPVANHALGKAIAPERWAGYLEDAVVQYCSTFDYTVGRQERDDIAQDIINQRTESNTFDSAEVALDALNYWRLTYGGMDAP